METLIIGRWWRSHQSLARERFTSFENLCHALVRCTRTDTQILFGERQLGWFKDSSQYRTLTTIDGEPMEFEWNIFPGFTTLQLCYKVQEFMSKWAYNQKISLDGLSSCRCSTTSHGNLKKIRKNCKETSQLVSIHAKWFSPGRWSFPRTWIRKEVVFYLYWHTTRRMGESRWIDEK